MEKIDESHSEGEYFTVSKPRYFNVQKILMLLLAVLIVGASVYWLLNQSFGQKAVITPELAHEVVSQESSTGFLYITGTKVDDEHSQSVYSVEYATGEIKAALTGNSFSGLYWDGESHLVSLMPFPGEYEEISSDGVVPAWIDTQEEDFGFFQAPTSGYDKSNLSVANSDDIIAYQQRGDSDHGDTYFDLDTWMVQLLYPETREVRSIPGFVHPELIDGRSALLMFGYDGVYSQDLVTDSRVKLLELDSVSLLAAMTYAPSSNKLVMSGHKNGIISVFSLEGESLVELYKIEEDKQFGDVYVSDDDNVFAVVVSGHEGSVSRTYIEVRDLDDGHVVKELELPEFSIEGLEINAYYNQEVISKKQ